MEFVDRRTLSRHNPIPPSQDTVTYPLRCGGNRGFNAHQKEFKRLEAFTNNKQRMMELVYRAWDNISWKVMDKSWACFFNNLRSIMHCRGDNNYKLAHSQGEKRQKDTGTAVDLSVNYEDYIACKDILARYNA